MVLLRPLKEETPCPVEGIVFPPQGRPTSVHRVGQASLVIYETKPNIQASSGGPNSNTCLALTLTLGPSATLESIYEAVGQGLTGGQSKPFTICTNSTGEAITLQDLHSGSDLVAYVDAQRASPHLGLPPTYMPIPAGPKPGLLSKNFNDMRPFISASHLRMMKQFGPVFKMELPPKTNAIVICDAELAGQVIEHPEIWQKTHFKSNKVVRGWVGQGVFTADDDEEIWGIAHRILLPAFSNQGMKQYFHVVQECIGRLFEQWDALVDANQPIDLTTWTERFTFDVIGKVGFGYDFDAMQTGDHPYLEQIKVAGDLSDTRRGLSFSQNLLTHRQFLKKWLKLNEPNVKFVEQIVSERKAELSQGIRVDEKDVLTLMLTAADPQTGQKLPADNVRDQILTFLLAGHDSTSTAITVLFMLLSQHGDVERKVVEEVERVIGEGPLTFEKLGKLEYCTAVINESLRMFPPAQANRKDAAVDTTLGPYKIPKGTAAIVSLWGLSHNPDLWPDPWKFDPDRWIGEEAKRRSPYASIPFSAGHRGCLGRQLSIMEQRSILVHTVRRYHLRLHSRSKPRFTTPLFLKPHDIYLSMEKKASVSASPSSDPLLNLAAKAATATSSSSSSAAVGVAGIGGAAGVATASAAGIGGAIDKALIPPNTRVLVLYGSNMGTCESYAGELAQHALKIGMSADLMSLDSFLSKQELAQGAAAVIIISSTYNGTPPDNATQFMRFLEDPAAVAKVFQGVPVSVFGCGNTQWARTYQAVPTAISKALQAAKAKPLTKFAFGDADSSLEEDFETWKFALWEGLSKSLGISGAGVRPVQGAAGLVPAYKILPCTNKIIPPFAEVASKWALQNGLFLGKVLENRELQAPGSDRSTHHIEIKLEEGMHYTAGDHLAVLGGNPPEVVQHAADILGLGLEDVMTVHKESREGASSSFIPEDTPLPVKAILTWCVELQHTAPRAQLSILADRAACPPEKKALEAMNAAYDAEVAKKKRSLLELMGAHRSAKITLAELLTLLPPLKARYYSISSSPRVEGDRVSITVGVVKGESPTGRVHWGVASNFLAMRKPGEPVRCFVKDTKSNFRLPADGSKPIILIGPGTGVAPLRGFLYDREASKATGPAVLFFGCRNDSDYIYREEMEGFQARGVLQDLQVAFSRKEGTKKVYVQQLIEAKGEELFKLLDVGGQIYVCGDAKHMAPDVREAFAKILAEGNKVAIEKGRALVDTMVTEKRYLEDVWASS